MKTHSLALSITVIASIVATGVQAGDGDRLAAAEPQDNGTQSERQSAQAVKSLAFGRLPDDEWTRTAIGAQRLNSSPELRRPAQGQVQSDQPKQIKEASKP